MVQAAERTRRKKPTETPTHHAESAKPSRLSVSSMAMRSPLVQPHVQTKLTVNQPGDKFEQQADAVASAVMHTPAPLPQPDANRASIQRMAMEEESVQRQAAPAEEAVQRQMIPEAETVQRKGEGSPRVSASTASTISSPGSGSPLSSGVRHRVEPYVGANLSGVRVHTGPSAQRAADSLNARAFTHRNNIFLNRAESSNDLGLMAHESTHVVQQGSAPIQRQPQCTNCKPKKQISNSTVQAATSPPIQQMTAMAGEGTVQDGQSLSDVSQAKALPVTVQPQSASSHEVTALKPVTSTAPASKSESSMQAGNSIESRLGNSKGGGSTLPDDVRSFMEPRFGADLSQVRVQTGDTAVQVNREVNDDLTAHELTHVVQQTGALHHNLVDAKVSTPQLFQGTSASSSETSNEGLRTDVIIPDPNAEASSPVLEKNLPPHPALTPRLTSRETEQPSEKEQAQADAQRNSQQVAQLGKPEFSRSVELARQKTQTEVNQPSNLTQVDGNNLVEVAKETKPEEISLPQAALTSKSENQAKTQAEGNLNNVSERSTSAFIEEQPSAERKEGLTNPAPENEVMQGALDKTAAQAEDVKGLEQQSTTALAETHSQVAQLSSTLVKFATPLQNPTNRTRVIAESGQRQAVATARASELVAYGGTRLQDLLALGQTALTDIQPTAIAAQATVDQSLAENRATIMAQINGMRDQVTSQAKSAQAQITQRHQTTIPALQAATTTARQRIEAAHTVALAALTASENTQTERIHQLYGQGERDFRAAGPKVGGEAIGVGRQRQAAYLSQRNGESSLLDGPLHDNRLEAKADAAVKVADAYKTKLIETANEQADKSREGKPKDLDTVRQVGSKSSATLQTHYHNALDGLTQAETQAIAQATETKNHLLQNVSQSLNATLNALGQQQATQLQQLADYGQQQKMAIARDAEHASASLQQGLTGAANTLQGLLQAFTIHAQETEAPDEAILIPVVEQIRNQFDGAVTQAELQYQQGITLSIQGINNSGQQASQTLNQSAQSSLEEISTGVAAFTDSMGQITQSANTTFAQMQSTHTRTATSSADDAVKGFQDITTGIETLFTTLNQRLEDGFKQSATGLEGSLRQVLSGKLENDITTQADKAAAEVQPRWKTVLKVLLVIVVIIVVALVIGPAVIGAVGAFAGALGASATVAGFIGATVGGAIVGAAAGATIQMGNNLIDGKNLLHDVGKALLIGAIGGALGGFGGALGQFLANTGRLGAAGLGQTVLKFGLERAFDVAGGIGGNLAVGDPITLEGILTGVAIAGAVSIAAGSLNSLGKFGGKIQAIQEGSFKAGAGFGKTVGTKVAGAFGSKLNVSGGSQSNAGSSSDTAKDEGTPPAAGQTEADSTSSDTAKDEGTTSAGDQTEIDSTAGGTAKDEGTPPADGQIEADSTSSNTAKDEGTTSAGDQTEIDSTAGGAAKDEGTPPADGQTESDSTSSNTAKDDGTTSAGGQTEIDSTAGGAAKDEGTTSAGGQTESDGTVGNTTETPETVPTTETPETKLATPTEEGSPRTPEQIQVAETKAQLDAELAKRRLDGDQMFEGMDPLTQRKVNRALSGDPIAKSSPATQRSVQEWAREGAGGNPREFANRYEYARAKFNQARSSAFERLTGQPDAHARAAQEAAGAVTPERLTTELGSDIQTVQNLGPRQSLEGLPPNTSPEEVAARVQGLDHFGFESETATAYHAQKHQGELPQTPSRTGDPVIDYMAAAQDTIRTGTVADVTVSEESTCVIIRKDYNGRVMEAIVYIRPDGRVTLATYGTQKAKL